MSRSMPPSRDEVDSPEVHARLQSALSLVRIGYPTHTPNKSPRRALEAVMVT